MKLGLVCKRDGQSFKKGFSGLKALKSCYDETIKRKKLLEATLHNIKLAESNIRYCAENNISAYRISSDIIAFHLPKYLGQSIGVV